MSLDSILQKTSKSRQVVENVPLFLPPEYSIDMEQWRDMIKLFNRIGRPTKVADVIQQYIREKNPGNKDLGGLISIDEIVEKDDRFYTNLSFETNKPGLTALVIYKAEDLQLVPVSSPRGDGGIRHVVMTYIPD
jgi:hypothetical protein